MKHFDNTRLLCKHQTSSKTLQSTLIFHTIESLDGGADCRGFNRQGDIIDSKSKGFFPINL